jgi:HK97 family phage prohead protease
MTSHFHAPRLRQFQAAIDPVGELQADVTISTQVRARDGDVWVAAGVQLDNYRRNPIVLFDHDPSQPIGTASNVRVLGNSVAARVTFATPGISSIADMVRGPVKDGVLRGVSCGILPIEAEPIEQYRPRDGMRITSWELLEISFTSVPADVGAIVTARSARRLNSRAARLAVVASLAHGPVLTAGERARAVAELMPRPPVGDGNSARFVAEVREYEASRAAAISARTYRELSPSHDRAQRRRAVAELAGTP